MVQTAPTSVTAFEVQCPGPDVYNDPDEIPDNTIIKITFVPDTGLGQQLRLRLQPPWISRSSLWDPPVTSGMSRVMRFYNVFHYSCYDMQSKALTVTHRIKSAGTRPDTNATIQAYVANEFDVTGGAGVTSWSGQELLLRFLCAHARRRQHSGRQCAVHLSQGECQWQSKLLPL